MAKKLENMTTDERIAHWEKKREKDKADRAVKINMLSSQQKDAVVKIQQCLDRFLDTAIYPDMGGVRAVSAYDLQELYDASEVLAFQFNLRETD